MNKDFNMPNYSIVAKIKINNKLTARLYKPTAKNKASELLVGLEHFKNENDYDILIKLETFKKLVKKLDEQIANT